MSTHTPGPWLVSKGPAASSDPPAHHYAIGPVDWGLRGGRYLSVTGIMVEADARLIAAAPDLLRELRTAWYMLQQSAPDADCSAIEAAIAKAEGGT